MGSKLALNIKVNYDTSTPKTSGKLSSAGSDLELEIFDRHLYEGDAVTSRWYMKCPLSVDFGHYCTLAHRK